MSEKTTKKGVAPKAGTAVAVVTPSTIVEEAREIASVETFISQAIASNLPVETMERLFALRKEVKAEIAREAFTAALAKFQGDCPTIEKAKQIFDKHGKPRYKYAPLDVIVDQVREALRSAQLSYTTDVIQEASFVTAVCKITHVMGHSETSSFKVPIDNDAYMSAPQKFAAALTFAKRYAFCNALGILTGDEDTDAAPEEPEVKTPPRVAAPTPRPVAPAPKASAPTIDPEVLEGYQMLIETAETVEQLREVWVKKIPAHYHPSLETVKNQKKADLQY